MKKWQVQITGHPYDLEDVYKNQSSASWSVVKDKDHFFMESVLFNDQEEADKIQEIASKIITLINGSAKLRIYGFRPIETGNVSYIDDRGNRHNFVLLQGNISARSRAKATLVVTKPEGSELEEEIEQPDCIKPTFALAESDPNVADALRRYASNELNWVGLYKIYEIIRDDVGGSKALFDKGFALKKDLRNFSHTAQHPGAIGDAARHARVDAEVPENPMSLAEANLLISTMMTKWIDLKLAT